MVSRITVVLLITLLVHLPLHAGGRKTTPAGKDTGLVPRKVLFGNPDKASPKLSPDGKTVALLAPRQRRHERLGRSP